jgi:hypothetical protein
MPKSDRQSSQKQISLYARISLIVFFFGLSILLLLISNADKLTSLGLIHFLKFLVLISMALVPVIFLTGVLKSSAAYDSKLLGGTLRLGGSVVVFGLVVVGGYFFDPNTMTFPLTVYVHGEGGPQDVVLRKSGQVVLELALERRREPIGENGEAYFPAIPVNFRG